MSEQQYFEQFVGDEPDVFLEAAKAVERFAATVNAYMDSVDSEGGG